MENKWTWQLESFYIDRWVFDKYAILFKCFSPFSKFKLNLWVEINGWVRDYCESAINKFVKWKCSKYDTIISSK